MPATTPAGRWGVVIVMLLALALRLLWLQDQSFSMDELAELFIGHSSLVDIFWMHDGFPPLYHSLLHGWLRLFRTDQSARWLSALLGTAAVWVVWNLARSEGNDRSAFGAALLAAVAPFQIWHSQEARAYILYYLLAACALWTFFTALRTDSRRAWWAYVAISLAGLLTHYYFALLVATNLSIMLVERRGRLTRNAVVAHVALAVLSTPVVWLLRGDLSAESAAPFATTFHVAAIGYTILSFLTGYTLGPSPRELHELTAGRIMLETLPWAVPIGIAAGTLLYYGLHVLGVRLWARRLLLTTLLPVVLCVGLAGLTGVTFQVRHVLWASIPLIVVLGAGCSEWRSHRPAGIALLAMLTLFGISRYQRHSLSRYQNEDLRGLSSYLDGAGSATPVFVLSGYMSLPVQYYLGDKWKVFPIPDVGSEGSNLRIALDYVDSIAPPGTAFWLAYTREFHGDPGGRFIDTLPRLRGLERRKAFSGLLLFSGGGATNR